MSLEIRLLILVLMTVAQKTPHPDSTLFASLDICSLTDLKGMNNYMDSLPRAGFCHLLSCELLFLELLESLNLLDTWLDLLDP